MTFLNAGSLTTDPVTDSRTEKFSDALLPKYRLSSPAPDPQTVFDLVCDDLCVDGYSRATLATFCAAYADDETRRLMDLPIDKSMIAKDGSPQGVEIDKRCSNMFTDLRRTSRLFETANHAAPRSNETFLFGGLGFKWPWKKRSQVSV